MAWIILLTNCRISGAPCFASDEPIQVSIADAKTLIAMRYAVPAEAPAVAPVAKRSKTPIPSES
jgi:hypothetical protein